MHAHVFCLFTKFLNFWFKFCLVAVKIITFKTVSSVIVYLKSKINNFFWKMESNHDFDDDYCKTMYKEGDDIITFPKAEPNESSLNRTDR